MDDSTRFIDPADLTVKSTSLIRPLSDWYSAHTILLHLGDEEVGRFDFGQSPPTFTGDVDVSAKLFVELVLRQFPSIQSDNDRKIVNLARNIRSQIWRTNHVKWQADSARESIDESAEEIITLLEDVEASHDADRKEHQ